MANERHDRAPRRPFVGGRIVETVTRLGAPLQVTGEPMTGIETVIAPAV